MRNIAVFVLSLVIVLLAAVFLTKQVFAYCQDCGTALCPGGGTSILNCCSDNPYPDACNGQPRTCTDFCPSTGTECTTAADCPNGSIQQQCGGKACNVAKACTNGHCTYTCIGIPPCGGGGPPPPPTPTPIPTPTPTPYPTTAVSGGLEQQIGTNNCSVYPGSGPVPTIGLTPQYPTGVTSACAANVPAGSYQCNISYNNRSYPSIPLSQSFTLNSYSPGYGTGWWRVGNACSAATDNTRTFSSGQVSSGNNRHVPK